MRQHGTPLGGLKEVESPSSKIGVEGPNSGPRPWTLDSRPHAAAADSAACMAPRDAALARRRWSVGGAAGRTCAEMVMFYPPGIPLLMPGEVVTERLDVCRQLLAAGQTLTQAIPRSKRFAS